MTVVQSHIRRERTQFFGVGKVLARRGGRLFNTHLLRKEGVPAFSGTNQAADQH